MYLFLGEPVNYWLGLKLLADENNLNSNFIAEYYRMRGELATIKAVLKPLMEK